MKYFLHDTSSFDDDKIGELFMKYGYEGLGLFYTILEKLAKQEKPIKTDVLKNQLRVGKKLEKCWQFMESLELIHSNNGETFNLRLMSYSEKYQIKKEKTRERVSQFRDNQENKENVTHYKEESNTPKVKESKVKESKDIIIPEGFLEVWEKWIEYKRTEKNQKYKTARSEQIAINKLVKMSNGDPAVADEIVDTSITNLYEGLFKLQNNATNIKAIRKPDTDVIAERIGSLINAQSAREIAG